MIGCKQCPSLNRSAFAELSDEELAWLDTVKTEGDYRRGDTFNVHGTPAQNVWCLREGSAKVTLEDSATGRQSLVRLAGEGDLLGYRCIFSEKHFRATASALVPSVACRISKENVFDLIEKNPGMAHTLLKRMGQEIARAEHHHHSFCQKSVRERLAEGLLMLAAKFGEKSGHGIKIATRLTRSELSNWVGTSRETVIRFLTEFLLDGLIVFEADQIVIVDDDGLRALIEPKVGLSSNDLASTTVPRN